MGWGPDDEYLIIKKRLSAAGHWVNVLYKYGSFLLIVTRLSLSPFFNTDNTTYCFLIEHTYCNSSLTCRGCFCHSLNPVVQE